MNDCLEPSIASQFLVEKALVFQEASFRHCHAPTIAATPFGIVAAWFAGTHEGHTDVRIWASRRRNGTWTSPVPVAEGFDRASAPSWNPVLYQVPDGPLQLFYKKGQSPESWDGLVWTSNDGGASWSEPSDLPRGIIGPTKNKPLLLGEYRLVSPSSSENERWTVHFEISDDVGMSWKKVGPLAAAEQLECIQPAILKHNELTLQALARSRNGCIVTTRSFDRGESWTPLTRTSLPNPNSGIDAVTLSSGLHMLVYNHSSNEGYGWGGPRVPLTVAVSSEGENWRSVLNLETHDAPRSYERYEDIALAEDRPIECSYPSIAESEDGLVHVAYTWNRYRIKHIVLNPDEWV